MTTLDVPFASDEYFALLGEHPELGPAFALGQQVIVVVDGTAYQVTAEMQLKGRAAGRHALCRPATIETIATVIEEEPWRSTQARISGRVPRATSRTTGSSG